MACGRRFGKTLAACAEAIREAVRKPGTTVWRVAPTYAMAMIGWRKLEELIPQALIKEKRLTERYFKFVNNSMIWVKSADNPDSLRGEGLDLVLIDEAAFVKEAAWLSALRPALADKQGRGVFISTPLGRNWYYQAFVRGQDEDDDEWQSWKWCTEDNPYIVPSEIEAARQSLPQRIFQQEFLAEFLEDAGAVFRKVVEAATALGRDNGTETAFGVDWGKHNDFTVITVLTQEGEMLAQDRFNQIDYVFQMKRLRAAVERYKPRTMFVEANAMGEPLVEQLQREGLPVHGFVTTHSSKIRMIEDLALAFEQDQLTILPDRQLINELQAFEMTRLPSGMIRYAAPQGLHDDCVISLALAWQALRKRPYKSGSSRYA